MATAQQTADDIRKSLREAIRLLSSRQQGRGGTGERVQAARFLKGQSPDLLSAAAEDVGVSLDALPALIEQFAPTPAPQVEYEPIPPNRRIPLSHRKKKEPRKEPEDRGPQGAPPSRFDAEQGRGNIGPRGFRNEKSVDNQPRPTIEDALGAVTEAGGVALGPGAREEVDNLRAVQRQFPTGENIAREAARQRPLDSWSRAEQYYEDLESTSDLLPLKRKTKGAPLAEGEAGPEEMPAPRATYAGKGTGRPLGPGGKAAGTQEDFAAYRTQQAIDDAVAERSRQQRIKFLRAGGRMTADGKNIAVMPDFGQAPPPKDKRSGDYQYASEIREERRLAENQRNKESLENFRNKQETDRIRRAEAEEFLSSMKDQIRTTERMARGLKRGDVRGGSADNLSSFFEDLDKTRAAKVQIRDKSKDQQVAWARGVLDARREEQKRLQEEEEEKRKRVAAASFQDLVNNRRNQPSYLDRY